MKLNPVKEFLPTMLGREFFLLGPSMVAFCYTSSSMISLTPKISRREWLGALIVGLVAALVGSWPWVESLWRGQQGLVYLGTNIPDVLDSQVYYAFIQSSANHGVYANLFTSESQPAALWNPLWWLLGALVRLTGLTPVTIFWSAKALLGVGLVLMIYRWAAAAFQTVPWRFAAVGLAVFGTGFGWMALIALSQSPGLIWIFQRTDLISILPTDLTYSAGYVWMSILHSPLYVLSEILILSVWGLVAIAMGQPKKYVVHLAGALTVLLGFLHPYDLVLLFGVIVAGVLIGIVGETMNQGQVKKLLSITGWLALWALPAALYYGLLIFFVPSISEWNSSNLLQTTNFRNILVGYGALSIFSFFGIRVWWKKNPIGMYLIGWLAMAVGLMYLPWLRWQAKMILGLSIPIGFLAAAGAENIWRVAAEKKRWLLLVGLGLTAITPIVFLQRLAESQRQEVRYHYAQTEMIEALTWLKNNSAASSVILGDVWTGNLVPQYAERATYLGHHHQTADYEAKNRQVRDWFFGTAGSTIEKEKFLREAHIDYVFWGPYERLRGPFNPATLNNAVDGVYANDLISIYRVAR